MVHLVKKKIGEKNYLYLQRTRYSKTTKKIWTEHVKYLGIEDKYTSEDIKKIIDRYNEEVQKMKLEDLKDKTKIEEIDVKVIWDQAEPKEMFNKLIKSVLIANADSQPKDGSPTAYLDLVGQEQIDSVNHLDKIKVTDGYAKLIQNNSGQFRITNIKKIEKIE